MRAYRAFRPVSVRKPVQCGGTRAATRVQMTSRVASFCQIGACDRPGGAKTA